MLSTNTTNKNRKPGRPKKIIENKQIPKNGIVSAAPQNDLYMDFLYNNPQLFKKLIQFFKALSSENLNFIFDERHIFIWAYDHFKKNKIYITIDCSLVNSYYIQNKFEISVSRANLKLILFKIDKNYESISFTSKKDSYEFQLYITLKNDTEIDEEHKIQITKTPNEVPEFSLFDIVRYDPQISFELTGRYFKKMIADINSFSGDVAVTQKSNADPLMFQYSDKDGKIRSKNIVKNKNKINLKSFINEDDIFLISFKVNYIKPISSSFLTENVLLYMREKNPILSRILMDDGVFDIRILTNINERITLSAVTKTNN